MNGIGPPANAHSRRGQVEPGSPTFWSHPPGQPNAPPPGDGEWVEYVFVNGKGWTHESELKPGDQYRLKGGGWGTVEPERVIGTTKEHPFYVRGKGWTPLAEIRPGDWLRTDNGWVQVTKIEDTGRYETVYNLRVADYHTMFVGSREWGFGVWAHNTCYEIRQIAGNKFGLYNSATGEAVLLEGRPITANSMEGVRLLGTDAAGIADSTISRIPGLTADGLLPPGVHQATLPDLMARFGGNSKRAEVLGNLEKMVADAKAAGLPVKKVYVAGSATTAKPYPGDFDAILVLEKPRSSITSPAQRQFLDEAFVKRTYKGDVFAIVEGDSALTEKLNFFSKTREGTARGVIEIPLK